eukprot:CAMPEP_0118672934 /NCGR_PEP_ID=MMETSP0800-20121206/42_1 /TAXON_ID=210618 ORGANISM="Striatella unipunctata, Strain CCMP2910" /NCGR_SAMPLE_ID=MMETSP0800 /ASSEMBLY_ACC=CAM_ASM_000638 /LENGTH=175 /DNA_ID=CAMNT_0006567941 /DNA_START=254 /DNA_END=781 /DNA_ORIENTATION=-
MGTIVNVVALLLFGREDRPDNTPWFVSALAICGVILIHNVLYYAVHKAMHHPDYYKYHRYHHRFNTYVTPSSANAVSIVEYAVAYVLPFIPCCMLIRPTEFELRFAAIFVSLCSLLVHTPCLEKLSQKVIPSLFVSTFDHQEHHRKLKTKYASPVVNVDWILEKMESISIKIKRA